jgi:hypothetical protein
MADKPANAGISGGLAGDLALPPAVHHSDYPRPIPGYRPAPAPAYRPEPAAAPHLRPEAGGRRRHGASRARTRAARAEAAARPEAAGRPLRPSWLAYLLVLAGVAIGMVIASYSSRDALTGIAVIAGALLAAALARLVLPPRYAGPLCTRSRTYDVLALTVLGGSVLAIVLTLP